jgi:Bacterial toxin 4
MQRALTYPNGVAKERKLTFPIKLCCTSLADLVGEPELEIALTRALGRAFAKVQAALPAPLAVGEGVVLKNPRLVNAAQVDARDADKVLERVRGAIEAAARARSLPLARATKTPLQQRRPKQPNAEILQPAELSERFDPDRYDAGSETYVIPSYQSKPRPAQRGTPTKVRPSGEAKRHTIPGAQCSGVRILLPNIIVFDGTQGPIGADLETVLDQSDTPRFISYDAGKDMFVVTPGESVILLKVTLSNRTQHDIDLYISYRDSLKGRSVPLTVTVSRLNALTSPDGGTTKLDLHDLPTLLRINEKLAKLTPDELEDYRKRATGGTGDWKTFEDSIDRYLAELGGREKDVGEQVDIETRLFGLDDLYSNYQRYLNLLSTTSFNASLAGVSPRTAGMAAGSLPTIERMRKELEADLIASGFPGGIADFEALLNKYFANFERETLALAEAMLERFEHVLWIEEQRYQDDQLSVRLYEAVRSKATPAFEEADKIREEHAQLPWTPSEMEEQSYWVGKREEALARGRQALREISAEHPLIEYQKFDQDALIHASSAREVRKLILDFIAERRKDIADTRKSLADKPRMIYGLDTLLEASFRNLNIVPGSLNDRIVRDHIRDVHWEEAIPQLVLAVIAIGAGLLTGGGGFVAVAAAGTTFLVGAYQAIEEFRRYERQSAAYGAQLTSDDPSFAWVIVSVVGAGIDAAAFAGTLRAVPKLREAISAFNAGNEAGDVAALSAKLNAIKELPPNVVSSIIKGANDEAKARASFRAFLGEIQGTTLMVIGTVPLFNPRRLIVGVYYAARRGIRGLQNFLATQEAATLIGSVAKLKPEELAALKTAYTGALREMEAIASRGRALNLSDDEIRSLIQLRATTPEMTIEEFTANMQSPRPAPNVNVPTQTAGTGGINWFYGFRARDGSQLIIVEGNVLQNLGRRGGFEKKLITGKLLGLKDYERAHLWGPRLGDEAAAGIWLAPESVNIGAQARVEGTLEAFAVKARQAGGELRLKVTGKSFATDELPANLRAHDFLSEITYDFVQDIPGKPPFHGTITISIGAPPNGRIELLGAASLDRLTRAAC